MLDAASAAQSLAVLPLEGSTSLIRGLLDTSSQPQKTFRLIIKHISGSTFFLLKS